MTECKVVPELKFLSLYECLTAADAWKRKHYLFKLYGYNKIISTIMLKF